MSSTGAQPWLTRRAPLAALTALVLVHAGLAGWYTLRNFDLGWQLAAGRYMIEQGSIPRHDPFSFTAHGSEWIYPAGSQLLLYLIYRGAGYAGLTALGTIVSFSTVALLLLARDRDEIGLLPGVGRLWVAALAVASVAARSSARADAFSVLLFAAVLVILWRRREGHSAPDYLLPALLVMWANLHQGFIFGLALFAPFLIDAIIGWRWRTLPSASLRRLSLIAVLSGLAVLLNPWGWRLYSSLLRVRADMEFQRGFIGEASPVPWGWWRLQPGVVADADGSIWLIALLSAVAAVVWLFRLQPGPALLLAGTLYLGLSYVRAHSILAMVGVVVLPGAFRGLPWSRLTARFRFLDPAVRWAALVLLVLLISVRIGDLVSNRYYVNRGDIAQFGAGASWWFPERALDFLAREKLPGRLYHDYNLGGWVMWKLWPNYQVFIDGRASPFMPTVFLEQQAMMAAPVDSREWQAFLDRWQINTLVVSLARFGGYRLSPAALCSSTDYRLVYMDEVSGVWIRMRAENRAWTDRLGKDCPVEPLPVSSERPIDRYNSLANAGVLYTALGHPALALDTFRRAEQYFPADPSLRSGIARAWQAAGAWDKAEQEYRAAAKWSDSGPAWHSLGVLQWERGRYEEASNSFRKAAQRSVLPHESYRMLGETLLALKRPSDAMRAFDQAEAASRYRGPAAQLGGAFHRALEDARARARRMSSP